MAERTVKWVALAGLLPATVILVPSLFYLILAMLMVLGAELAHPDAGGRTAAIRNFGGLILMMAAPLAGMAVTWTSLLVGPQIFRRPRSRIPAACGLLLLGIGVGGWWLYYVANLQQGAGRTRIGYAALWIALVFCPMLVGAREFFRIARGSHDRGN